MGGLSAGTVSGTRSERRMSVYTVAGHEPGPVCALFRVQPVSVHTVRRAESVSVYPMCRAELVSVDAVGRVEPVSVCSVSGTPAASLYAVRRTESVWGVSVHALSGAEADHGPRAASGPQGSVAYGGQSSWNLQQRAAATGPQRGHGACGTLCQV
ncbi:hypothetical protein F2P81_025896 [Scophthalmus maximus]|uniref:Uncharacterized protein n=1 Tax=Scophthalmus maximus TaxID=52904 RepID=A0A6A4RRI9_SCOMX|nr:hypothetical protein F2P81_025896 [Scophthalmus maximus]